MTQYFRCDRNRYEYFLPVFLATIVSENVPLIAFILSTLNDKLPV